MNRTIRLTAVAALAAGILVLAPAAADATRSVSPTTLTFAAQNVGTTSAPQTATVTVTCTVPVLGTCPTAALDTFSPAASATGDFAASESCPASITPGAAMPVTCDYAVTFTPTGAGTRTGTLSTGTGFAGAAGPTVALSGTGTAPPTTPAVGGTAGKCKKGKSKKKKGASAAKKKGCKKRKKKGGK